MTVADRFVRRARGCAGRSHVSDSVGQSRSAAEPRAYEWLRIERTLRSERASEQNAERSVRIDLGCCRHGVLLRKKRRGTPVPVAGEQSSPLGIPSHLTARRGWSSRVAAREKKKAPGPCELR